MKLRPGGVSDRQIDAPVVHLEGHGGQRGDGIDHVERRVPSRDHGLAQGRDVVDHGGGGIDLDHQHRLDFVSGVFAQARLQLGRIDGAAPVAGQRLDLEPEHLRHLAPAGGEQAALQHQNLIAPGQHVAQRRLPGAMTVGDVDVSTPLGPKHPAQIFQAGHGHVLKRARIDVDRRAVHGAQDFVGHRGRARNAQKFTAVADGHRA